MDKKLIGTAAVIGVVAGYMYSKDVFNSATFAASDSKCVNGVYNTMPAKKKDGIKFSKITLDGSKKGSSDNSKRWYNVTNYIHRTTGSQGTRDDKISVNSYQGIQKAMKYAKQWKHTANLIFIHDVTGDYCYQEEKPVDDEQEDKPPTTDWCAVKANSPKKIKAIPSQIKSEIAKATKKVEKEGAEELARLEARYEKAKKNCSAKEEVQKKLKDTDIGEGFWEKLLAYLNA